MDTTTLGTQGQMNSSPMSPVDRRMLLLNDSVSSAVPSTNRDLSDPERGSWLIESDVFDAIDRLNHQLRGKVTTVFADPPYFVGKGDWDRPKEVEAQLTFAEEWLAGCRDLLADNGSLWGAGPSAASERHPERQ